MTIQKLITIKINWLPLGQKYLLLRYMVAKFKIFLTLTFR